MDKLFPLDLPPGMRNTGTVYESKGRWYTGNFVRFFQGMKMPIGGWAARTLTGATIAGVPRAMVSYQLVGGTQILVIGTTTGLYVVSGSVKYDITPADIASAGNDASRVWQLDVFGTYLVACPLLAPSTGAPIYYWAGNTATPAALIDNGLIVSSFRTSQQARSIVVTPERFLVQLGGTATSPVP